MKPRTFVPLVALVAVLAVACSRETASQTTPAGDETAAAKTAVRPDRVPLLKSGFSDDGLQVILGTDDLGVGLNRFGFVLISTIGFVTEPAVTVSSRFIGDAATAGATMQTAPAELKPWPYGERGLYVAYLTFDRAGDWGIDIVVAGPESSRREAELVVNVAPATSAPAVGSPAIYSENKTVRDVESLAQLTTGSLQDPDLYQATIAEAISSDMPTVVVFASPAFCANEVCGPQLEVLQEVKDEFKGQGSFIHVDFYDNPDEIQGDLDKAQISPTVLEWGLPSIEWTFVIDRSGIVTARFEGFATLDEVRDAFRRAM